VFCTLIKKKPWKLMLFIISFWAADVSKEEIGRLKCEMKRCGLSCKMQMKCQHAAKVVNEISPLSNFHIVGGTSEKHKQTKSLKLNMFQILLYYLSFSFHCSLTDNSSCSLGYCHPFMCTVSSDSIHTPWLFPHFVVFKPAFKMDYIAILCHWPTHNTP
jgi:hypothetical protein